MVFSSVTFLFYYLPLLLGIYYLAPAGWRNMILLLSSLGFYFWGAGKLFYVIFVSIVLDYFLGLVQGSLKQEWSRRACIWFSVFANLGILFYFKYSNFFIGEVNGIVTSLGFPPLPVLSVLLPIGLSFLPSSPFRIRLTYIEARSKLSGASSNTRCSFRSFRI